MAQRKVDLSRAPFLFLIPLIGLALAAAAISLPFAQAEEAGAAAIMAAGGGVEVARHESRRVKCRRFLFSFGRCARAMTKLRRQEPTREAAPAQRRPATRRSRETVVARKAGPRPNFRTLCVRSCDGYYFPISNATTRSRFKTDEAVCKAMNGGAPAELYVHPVDGGIADAVSLEQKPYRSQPFAFAFHLTFRPACQATLQAGLANLARIEMAKVATKEAEKGKKSAAKVATSPEPAPIPIPRIHDSEDPETIANRAGDVRPATETGKLAVMRDVRQVGPAYYYSDPLQLTVPVPAARRGLIGPANAEAAQTAKPPS